ncbi:MAG TPA: ABC transporter permease subunit, partial [Tianweitania sediminis]|nr:ABC transporter permease subunit [Tianweitania sediminis]
METAQTLLSFGPEGWGDEIASGVLITVSLALATLPFGLVLGFLVALAKQSEEPSMRLAGNIYTTIFRGLPELLTLFLIYYGAQLGVQQVLRLSGTSATIEINAFAAGMVALGIMFSSYASEVFLSAFRAIPKGQYEGGYAVGLS